jgi:hypothetical protein
MGQVRVLHVSSSRQFADILTKGLPSPLFLDFWSNLNVRSPPVVTAGDFLKYVTLCDMIVRDMSHYVT